MRAAVVRAAEMRAAEMRRDAMVRVVEVRAAEVKDVPGKIQVLEYPRYVVHLQCCSYFC